MKPVRLKSATIDTFRPTPEAEERMVIRGVLDLTTILNILTPVYQREVIDGAKQKGLIEAVKKGEILPDIELAMRGDRTHSDSDGMTCELRSETFVLDGLQRISAIKKVIDTVTPAPEVHLGVVVHIDTTESWERNRFRILNQERLRVSPNVIIRNAISDHPGVELLHQMSQADSNFNLKDRVQWGQQMTRSELITARQLLRVAQMIHIQFGSGLRGHSIEEMMTGTDRLVTEVGPNIFRANVRHFFDVIDQCFGIRAVHFRNAAPQVKDNFLMAWAEVYGSHTQFWNEKRLFVDARWKAKARLFKYQDPEIIRLSGAGGVAVSILKSLIIEHLNSGKRIGHLKRLPALKAAESEGEDEEMEGNGKD